MIGERLRVAEDGTVWAGDFRLPFRIDGGVILFFDKDKRRAARRGSAEVRVEWLALLSALTAVIGGNRESSE